MQIVNGQKIDISCTWGEGPDVCVNIYDNHVFRKGYTKGFYPLDFTAEEAIQIGKSLIDAGEQAQRMKREIEELLDGDWK